MFHSHSTLSLLFLFLDHSVRQIVQYSITMTCISTPYPLPFNPEVCFMPTVFLYCDEVFISYFSLSQRISKKRKKKIYLVSSVHSSLLFHSLWSFKPKITLCSYSTHFHSRLIHVMHPTASPFFYLSHFLTLILSILFITFSHSVSCSTREHSVLTYRSSKHILRLHT